MDDNATPAATLLRRVEDYSKTTVELIKLTAIDNSVDVVSSFVSRLAIYTTVALSLLILSIGLALWIGKLLGDSFYGFFVIGGLYSILTVALYLFRNELIKYPVSNSIIKQLLNQK